MQRKGTRISVPQFGGWDQKGGGASSDGSAGYTMVFTKARADRQHLKNDFSEVKRQAHQLQDLHQYHHGNLPGNKKHKTHHLPHHKKHKSEDERASASSAATPNQMVRSLFLFLLSVFIFNFLFILILE